eukprot:GHVT01075892.1.p1 GENE.GHVT01075892.1~~GHVT01075892.1.p1  ORF type:complete len:398 (-),score=33.90 GHVT01075892.1:433-1626(-)
MSDVIDKASYTSYVTNGMAAFLHSRQAKALIDGDHDQFIRTLKKWMSEDDFGKHYRKDFHLSTDTDAESSLSPTSSESLSTGSTSILESSNVPRLTAWKFEYFQKYVLSTTEARPLLDACRQDVIDHDLGIYGECFFFAAPIVDVDEQILLLTIRNMGIALVCIIVVSSLVIPGIFSALLVVAMVLSIDVCLFGFMALWGVKVNMISMVNLVISIGFSIDYTAHITHAFTHCPGNTRAERMAECLTVIGAPVFHGAMSTGLMAVSMFFADKQILVVFAKMMVLVLTFSLAHGLLLLPVMLSIFGPMKSRPSSNLTQLRSLLFWDIRPASLRKSSTCTTVASAGLSQLSVCDTRSSASSPVFCRTPRSDLTNSIAATTAVDTTIARYVAEMPVSSKLP